MKLRDLLVALLTTVLLAVLVLSLPGCSGGSAAGEGFFPLERGHRWTYEQRTDWENAVVERERLVLSTLGRGAIPGLPGEPAWRRRSDSGVEYWLRSDASGIYRVAMKSDLQAEAVADPAPRYVLKAPLAAGTSWQAPTTAYLLKRRQEFPREIRHSQPPVPMTYAIEAVGETVEVRAGRWEGCLRVRGEARMRVFADPVAGWKDLPLTTREWYCPGVGLVRLERQEPAASTFLTGGTMQLELVEWQ